MNARTAAIALLPLLALVAGCGGDTRSKGTYTSAGRSSADDRGYYKIGKPYQVAGLWYYPREDFALVESGTASWYGPDFHGQPTANGEAYDMHALTAAHRTLQMPSVVRVVNLDNGRETVVRINDRGPFARERIIDLSRRAAEEIGMTGRGTAQVRVEVLPDESRRIAELAREGADQNRLDQFLARRFDRRSQEIYVAQTVERPLSDPYTSRAVTQETALPVGVDRAPMLQPVSYEVPVRSGSLFVQAGAFSVRDNAERLRSELSHFGDARIDHIDVNGRTLHRVRLGPLGSVDAAQATLSRLAQNGYALAQVVVE